MMSMDDTVRLAIGYAEEGFLCSEAVLMALSECLGVSSEIIPRIATGFGAGLGRNGEVCGALSGGVMGLGLRLGRSAVEEGEGERRPYWFSTELAARFREQLGHVRCEDLLGLDLSRVEDVETYHERGLWETTCRDIIKVTTHLAYDILMTDEVYRG
jgi:C_GCAxxG_C_C family probable redox protein